MRVLVVDDSKNMRAIVKRYIESGRNDVEFFEAGNGEDADRILQECSIDGAPIDIVVLDWMMPKMSGFEFLKKIREVEQFQSKPAVIMLTAETYVDQINAATRYGVSVYLTKPFTDAQILDAIEVASSVEVKHAV